MSGEWAKACDRRIKTHTFDSGWGLWSAHYILDALTCDNDAMEVRFVEAAGMHLRTWRKSLSKRNDLTGRQPDLPRVGIEQEWLLWMALACVAQTGGTGNPVWAVRNLRHAEAFLRTWWKRNQEKEER